MASAPFSKSAPIASEGTHQSDHSGHSNELRSSEDGEIACETECLTRAEARTPAYIALAESEKRDYLEFFDLVAVYWK
jgi:hypothetical protein